MSDAVADRLTMAASAAAQMGPFDAVVVGGGSAGITAARTLCEKGKRVVLLEAGPLGLLTHVQATDLRFDPALVRGVQQALSYSPQNADGGTFGALIGCLGGRGLFWNGAAPRFDKHDFENWPLSSAELGQFYEWAEEQFRVTTKYSDGRLARLVIDRLAAAGISAVPGPYAIDCHPNADGWLGGTVGNSLAPLLRSTLLSRQPQKLIAATRAFARMILIENGRAVGVEAVDLNNGSLCRFSAASVVLAAGAFESTRLAMVSDVPNPHGLLGRYISDHIFVRAYFPIPDGIYDPSKPEVAIVWLPASATGDKQVEIHLPSDNLFVQQETSSWAPDQTPYYAAMVRSFAPIQPRIENFIEALPGDKPGSYKVHLSMDADDQALAQSQIQLVEKVRNSIGALPSQIQTLPLGASHHEAGGMLMGESGEASVTDGYGRVRGVERLVVCDSASWPSVSPANPHLTIVAMSRRQAAQLASEL